MTIRNYDIVVIGAGPAGALAAQFASKGGRRVCLVERKEKVGVPVRCGEGIGLKGFIRTIPIQPQWILSTISRITLVSPGGIQVHATIDDPSFIVDRTVMDADLVGMARDAGADYCPATGIDSISRDEAGNYCCAGETTIFQSPCIILADGIESRLARDLGWSTTLAPEDVESCAFCKVKHPSINPDTCIFHVGSSYSPGGYLWVFPRGNGFANVGLGVNGSRCAAGKPRELLERFIEKTYPGAVTLDMHAGGVPAGIWLNPLVRDGAMVVGDAARQVNSLSGAGIAFSLLAGKMAGRAAAGAFTDGRFDPRRLRSYQKEWAANFGKQQKRSYALKNMLLKSFDDRMLDSIASSLSREKAGRLNYVRVFMRAFAGHPLMLIKVMKLFR
jgi:digeranylgeranylglycerophospholipid reductase